MQIGELEVGDKVWAYNTETGENEAKEITAVIVTETDVIVYVKTSDGEDIETTMFHPFYVRHSDRESDSSVNDGEWKAASNLLAGDVLQKVDGNTVYVTEVTVEKLPEIINVYNLEIEDLLHTMWLMGCWCIISIIQIMIQMGLARTIVLLRVVVIINWPENDGLMSQVVVYNIYYLIR